VADRLRRFPLRFGIFEADLEAGELRKRGLRVRLPHQAFRVLQVLIEHPGQVITREELRRSLWPTDTFVEFDHSLNNAISRVRDALDDSSTSPRFIETLPRRGYRFIAPVETVRPDDEAPPESATVPTAPPLAPSSEVGPVPHARRSLSVALGATALVMALAGAAYWFFAGSKPSARSVAVLPLVYGSPPDRAGDDYLANGMTDALITELSKLGALQVISETSTRRYKDSRKTVPEIARELGVEAIVEGSVFREGDVIRVTVQLIRADTDTHLLTQTYTRPLGNILALQSELATTIAREIGARITPQEQQRMARARSIDPEAYRLYVTGSQLREKETEPELREALDQFHQALEIEPTYARAYWGIAETWISLAGWGAYVPPREGFPKAKAAATSALEIDESLGEAHSARAFVSEVYERDFNAAERSYQRALSLSPNDALAHQRYSLFLNRTGRRDEGVRESERAYHLDPLSVDNNISLGMRLYANGQREAGIAVILRATELDPTHFDGWVHLGEAYKFEGKQQDAVDAARRGVELSRGAPHAVHMLASIYLRFGERQQAEALVKQLEASPRRNAYELAMIRLDMGDSDRAVDWLLNACGERTPQMAFFQFVQGRKTFDAIRADPRFAKTSRCWENGEDR